MFINLKLEDVGQLVDLDDLGNSCGHINIGFAYSNTQSNVDQHPKVLLWLP